MAIYKRGREFELGTTEHKSSKWPERDSNPGPPDCESDALTTRPRCLHKCATLLNAYSASRGLFSLAWLLALTKSFMWLVSHVVGLFYMPLEKHKAQTS